MVLRVMLGLGVSVVSFFSSGVLAHAAGTTRRKTWVKNRSLRSRILLVVFLDVAGFIVDLVLDFQPPEGVDDRLLGDGAAGRPSPPFSPRVSSLTLRAPLVEKRG